MPFADEMGEELLEASEDVIESIAENIPGAGAIGQFVDIMLDSRTLRDTRGDDPSSEGAPTTTRGDAPPAVVRPSAEAELQRSVGECCSRERLRLGSIPSATVTPASAA